MNPGGPRHKRVGPALNTLYYEDCSILFVESVTRTTIITIIFIVTTRSTPDRSIDRTDRLTSRGLTLHRWSAGPVLMVSNVKGDVRRKQKRFDGPKRVRIDFELIFEPFAL